MSRAQTLRGDIGALGIASHDDQRQPGPWQNSFDPAPQPHGLVEDFEDRFVDASGSHDPAVRPPRQSAGLVELEADPVQVGWLLELLGDVALDDVNEAFQAMERQEGIRTVIEFQ